MSTPEVNFLLAMRSFPHIVSDGARNRLTRILASLGPEFLVPVSPSRTTDIETPSGAG